MSHQPSGKRSGAGIVQAVLRSQLLAVYHRCFGLVLPRPSGKRLESEEQRETSVNEAKLRIAEATSASRHAWRPGSRPERWAASQAPSEKGRFQPLSGQSGVRKADGHQ